MDFDPHEAINYIYKQAPEYGKAKGRVAELEAYKSSLKAILMSRSTETTIGGQEKTAYASEEYQNLCKAIGEATEQAETLKWRLESAKMRFEAYKVQEYNNRQLDKMVK
jgi:phage shock protein A